MKPTPSSRAAPFVIPSLDGLRAVSFLLVFLGHAGSTWIPIPAGFGVTVFFFLSGYLITTLLRVEFERSGRNDLKHFYLRRVLRIWPPFYLVLFGGLALTVLGVIEAPLHAPAVTAQALHVSNYWVILRDWSGVVPGSGVYWSLAVEEHFYLLFPALYVAVNRRRLSGKQQFQLFLFLCALILVWRCVLVYGLHVGSARTFVATDTRIDSILFGCALAVYRNPILDAERKDRPELVDVLALVASVAVLFFTFVYRDDGFRETLRYTIQGLALYPIFTASIRFPEWGLFRLLNWKPVRFIGTLSYSLYLVHYTVIIVLEDKKRFSQPLPMIAILAVCCLLAYAIWYLVEEPSAKLRRRLSGAFSKPIAPTRSETPL